MGWGRYFCVTLLAASLACASAPPTPPPPVSDSVYRLGMADEVQIRILPEPVIEQVAIVRPDGAITVELIGDIEAAGHTTDEIARTIEQRILQYRHSPRATVVLGVSYSTAVDVLGEVKSPGRVRIAGDTRLADAIALAGGSTELAAKSRVRIIRSRGEESFVFLANLDEIREGKTETNLLLTRGDIVVVPAATPVVVGYWIRRALYPVEMALAAITRGFVAVALFF